MNVSFKGWREQAAAFETEQELQKGHVVKISGNGQVSNCEDGGKFAGMVISCREGLAAVQLQGYAEVRYTGTAPTPGYQALCADGKGGVKVVSGSETGRDLLILTVDEVSKTVGVVL